jgi:hypothetical protein
MKRKYEAPIAVDLGGVSAVALGQTDPYPNPYAPKPNCTCYSGCGESPQDCRAGGTPGSGTCQSGGHPSGLCTVGSAAGHY